MFTVEPPPQDSKLIMHENVTATPHLGASTTEAQVQFSLDQYECVYVLLNGVV